jgi:dGTPase
MAGFGGFEHNGQTLRIVDFLEHPYADFEGLNLMYETRLAFARHHSPYDRPQQDRIQECNCSMEGQIADVADRIAYNCHDLEDGMRSRLIDEEQIKEIELVRRARDIIMADSVDDYVVRRTRIAKAIIDYLVSDCIDSSAHAIQASGVKAAADVCNLPQKLIVLSSDATARLVGLEKFLLENLYCHDTLLQANKKVEKWVTSVFDKLCGNIELMPRYFQRMVPSEGLQRTVCDYIAGTTDRYCLSLIQ